VAHAVSLVGGKTAGGTSSAESFRDVRVLVYAREGGVMNMRFRLTSVITAAAIATGSCVVWFATRTVVAQGYRPSSDRKVHDKDFETE